MLNDEDVNKLTKAFGEIFATKQDFQRLEEKNQKNFSYLPEFKNETHNSFLDLRGEISYIKNDISEMKNDMADLKELVQGLIVSTDNIAKAISNLSVEYAAIATQLSRHELWIKQIAEKVGLKLSSD